MPLTVRRSRDRLSHPDHINQRRCSSARQPLFSDRRIIGNFRSRVRLFSVTRIGAAKSIGRSQTPPPTPGREGVSL